MYPFFFVVKGEAVESCKRFFQHGQDILEMNIFRGDFFPEFADKANHGGFKFLNNRKMPKIVLRDEVQG